MNITQKKTLFGKYFAPKTELRDTIEARSVKPSLYGSMKKVESTDGLDTSYVAIIAFWRMEENGEFTCYRHFTVPNPQKRTIKKQMTGAKSKISQQSNETEYQSKLS